MSVWRWRRVRESRRMGFRSVEGSCCEEMGSEALCLEFGGGGS